MNPVDLYHDPSLDNLIYTEQGSRRSSHTRRASDQVFNGADIMPYAPDVPQNPPISYRGGPAGAGPPQRSFSQRAKGRPYAREAFEEYEGPPRTVQDPRPNNAPRQVPQPPIPLPAPQSNRAPAQDYALPKDQLRINTNLQNQENARARRQVSQSSTAANPPRRPSGSDRPPQSAHPQQVPLSAVSRSSARATADGGRDWAPDRSPLQKLEVTLNDISKEEKRARVQEAEMLLRESKARRAGGVERESGRAPQPVQRNRSVRKDVSSAVIAAPTIEDSGLVRNLSQTHRDRLQHSTVIENTRPDVRMLSGEGKRGFDYSPSQPEPAPMSLPRRVEVAAEARRTSNDKGVGQAQSMPVHQQQQPNSASRSVDQSRQMPTLVERERNASHKATLAKLTGDDPASAPQRTGSRKLQKAPPIDMQQRKTRQRDVVPEENLPQTKRIMLNDSHDLTSRNTSQASEPQTITPPPRIRDPNALGTGSPAFSSPMSSRLQREPVGKRQSKSSVVTFKEPISKRPVDEWKEAKTARLTLADLTLDKPQVEPADKSKAWWEESGSAQRRRRRSSASYAASTYKQGDVVDDAHAEFRPRLFIRCGPLLRYLGLKRIKNEAGQTEGEVWRGSVMIVTQDTHSDYQTPPTLRLFSRPKTLLPPPPEQVGGELPPEYIDPLAGLTKMSRIGRPLYVRPVDHLEEGKDLSQIENDEGLFESAPSLLDTEVKGGQTTASSNNRTAEQDGETLGKYQEVQAARLYADPDRDVTFWRFNIEVELTDVQQHISYRINRGASSGFWVPARGQSMNIMFHSCNGFSLAVNTNQFSGPDPLWRDVLNIHQTRPFHVMLGGGDQIYNDRCTTETQLFGEWLKIRNPNHKHHAPFTNDMKEELETFYLNRYCMWFSQGLFGMANSQIPMVNVWDDHDIIDGFGSYPDHFMKTPVFSGLGNVAFKYYMLFQHQSVAEETAAHEPSWVLGHEPGPYIHQQSRSIFMHLGQQIAFLGVDCRTERMRDEILSIRTFDNLLERCRQEIVEGETKHLLVLLGVPIAYPRLVWLENVLTSRAMDPLKALNRMGVMKSGFLNKFDGGVEILDDLDDHWTASHHKSERNDLITDLQDLAAEKSVRITILGGDVHLAAVGQFRSNPKLKIPKDHDHRYMPNVISSAIVNTPPPDIMADILNKRNKVHTMDKYTEEDMIPMFTHDVDRKRRNNVHLLPRRNWCSIRTYHPGSTPLPSPPSSLTPSVNSNEDDIDELSLDSEREPPRRRFSFSKEPANLLRKLSTKGAPPPSAYPQGEAPQRSASYDGSQPAKRGFFGRSLSLTGRRASDESGQLQRSASLDRSNSKALPVRPGILRRPTNLSEKAARKGNVPAIDAEGNEIDVNDTIDLVDGLDIVLNVEVNQKDPAGITTPYRLLVPALWYDGSSDREKLPNTPTTEKKGPLLGRMFSRRNGNKVNKGAARQGQGNWGQEFSDSESYSGGEDTLATAAAPSSTQKQPPRRRFSLFGSRRAKQDSLYSSSSDEESDPEDPAGGLPRQGAAFNQPPGQTAQQQIPQRHSSAPQPRGQGAYDPRRIPQQHQQQQQLHHGQGQRVMQMPETHDPLYDVSNQPPNYHASRRVPVGSAAVPQQQQQKRSLTIGSNAPQVTMAPPRAAPAVGVPEVHQKQHHTHRHGQHQHAHAHAQQQQPAQQAQRPSHQGRVVSETYPIQQPQLQPQKQSQRYRHENDDEDDSTSISSLSDDGGAEARYPQVPPPKRTLSKQERVLGMHEPDTADGRPGQMQGKLRGEGIIGAGGYDGGGGEGYDDGGYVQDEGRPKRGFSFKRARDWLDGKEGRY